MFRPKGVVEGFCAGKKAVAAVTVLFASFMATGAPCAARGQVEAFKCQGGQASFVQLPPYNRFGFGRKDYFVQCSTPGGSDISTGCRIFDLGTGRYAFRGMLFTFSKATSHSNIKVRFCFKTQGKNPQFFSEDKSLSQFNIREAKDAPFAEATIVDRDFSNEIVSNRRAILENVVLILNSPNAAQAQFGYTVIENSPVSDDVPNELDLDTTAGCEALDECD